MSIRSNWCEFDKDIRKYIKKRDKEKCVICGNKGALQIMHIFLSRAYGGKGCKENGCLGCVKCHRIIDNPIGSDENKLSKELLEFCKNYLIEKENINYNSEFIDSLKYKKELNKIEFSVNCLDLVKKKERCKNCKYLVKNKYNNSSISSYYCVYRHMLIHKSSEACKNFKSNIN